MDERLAHLTWDVVEGCTKVSTGCKHCYAQRVLGDAFSNVRLFPERLGEPMSWRGRRIAFIADNSDLMHEQVPGAFIQRVLDVIRDRAQHEFIMLTKRPARAAEFDLPANIWFGVSAEDQETLDYRAPYLRDCGTRVKFISAQPLLGPLNLADYRFDWVVVGGEYGPSPRPMDMDWVRSIRDQAEARGVPFSFQQAMIEGRRVVFPKLDGKSFWSTPWART